MKKTPVQIAQRLATELVRTDRFHEDLEPGEVAWLLGELTAEVEAWRKVFGHLGSTPDECGNAIYNSAAEQLADEYGTDTSWGEHPVYSRSSWQNEVSRGDVQSGYWDWAVRQIEQEGD